MLATLTTSNFLEDLAMVLCVGAISTVLFQAMRQPIVVGYLVAGAIVGPYLPIPLLANYDRIHTLSELGVILLMFALGLEFSIRKLLRLGPTSGFIMLIQVGLMLWLGYICGRALGWTQLESIFTGALLSISSTTIVAKAFDELKMPERLRDLVFGVLLMEDLAAVVELAILTALASGAGVSARDLAATVGRLALFLGLLIGIGILVVPRLIKLVVKLQRPETTLIASIGICFAFAIIAEHAGYSVALGAFLAGSLVAESGDVHQIEQLVAPVRDMFGAVFFVSVGMMINPYLIVEHWVALVVLTLAVVIGKVSGVTVASLMSGAGVKTSVEAGMSLAQIGEFSFIIAGVGLQLGATRDFIYTMAVAVSAITTFMTPFMIKAAVPVGETIASHFPEPVSALQSLYDSWMERIKNPRTEGETLPAIHWPILIVGVNAVIIASLLIFNEFDPENITGKVAQMLGVPYFDAGIGVDLVALVLCIPFGAGIYYGSRRLAMALAMRAIPIAKRKTLEIQWENAERALIEMLQLTILLGVMMGMLVVVQPFMEPVEGIAIIVIATVLMAFVIWRSARLMQGQMLAAVDLLTASLGGRPALDDKVRVREHEVPGLGSLTAVRVQPNAQAVGRSLSELDLQAATGATVVALARDGGDYAVPEPDLVLRAGDVLELAGSSDSVAAAASFLSKAPAATAAASVA